LSSYYEVRSDRERALEAMLRTAAAKGYEETTVAEVSAAAGLRPEEFEAMFSSKEACFLEAHEAAIGVLVAHVTAAWERAAAEPWPERIVAALRALLELLSQESEIVRTAMLELDAVGEEARLRYRHSLDRFVPFLEEGRAASPRGENLPAETARLALGGATSLVFDAVRAGRGAELSRLLPQLAFVVLMPYLGPEVAEEMMARTGGS
jgi:AcrR family transcriptional regulator